MAASPYPTRLWRTLALCMVIAAAGLGAYYYLVQQPLQARYLAAQQELDAVHQEIAAAQKADPTPSPLPQDRLQEACARYKKALRPFPKELDRDATNFAVEELARSAKLDSYRVSPKLHPDTPVQGVEQSRITLALDGESVAIERLIRHLRDYGKAGHVAALTLGDDEDKGDDARARLHLAGNAALDAYTVPDAAQLAASRCQELGEEE